jgi:BASS family bile acid:Na+ symporter
MFNIGSGIRIREIKSLVEHRKPVYIGLVFQILLLPLFAFLTAHFAPIPVGFKLGIILVSICPGGTTSNYISYMVKGDTPLSVVLTVVNSLLIFISIPIYLQWAAHLYLPEQDVVNIPLLSAYKQVLFVVLLPSLLGIFYRFKIPRMARKFEPFLKVISSILLAVVFLIKFIADKENGGTGISIDDVLSILPYALFVHLGSYFGTYFLSKKLCLTAKQSLTLAIEVGLQNTALAILLASLVFQSQTVAKPALVFALFTFFTTLLFSFMISRKIKS